MKYTDRYWDDIKIAIASVPNINRIYGKNVLITGASGMICSAVIDVLLYLNKFENAGITVYAAGRDYRKIYDRFFGFNSSDGLIFVPYDATKNETISVSDKIDYIIHGASNANPAIYKREPVETILANVLGLNELLKFAVDVKAKRLLYVSSSEVYGEKEDNEPYSEDDYGYIDVLSQRSGYPLSKRTGESLCIAYSMEHSIETVIVRPGHIYGPTIQNSDNRASAEFSRRAAAGLDIIMKSEGKQLRSYCYTLDCASAMIVVLINGESQVAYNISNAESICSIRDIADMIATKAGVKVIFDAPTEDEKNSYNPMSNSSLKSERIEAIGWHPAFSLEHGVESTIQILKEK